MLKSLITNASWINAVTLIANILNQILHVVPFLQGNQWVIFIQAILAAFLTSPFGIAHKLAFGENQDPATR